jgi:hypothetical protein
MSNKWFVIDKDEEFGPFSGSHLKAMAMEGRLSRSSLVKNDLSGKIIKAGAIKGLEWNSSGGVLLKDKPQDNSIDLSQVIAEKPAKFLGTNNQSNLSVSPNSALPSETRVRNNRGRRKPAPNNNNFSAVTGQVKEFFSDQWKGVLCGVCLAFVLPVLATKAKSFSNNSGSRLEETFADEMQKTGSQARRLMEDETRKNGQAFRNIFGN